MSAYQLTPFDTILRVSDGACIPPDTSNNDYREFLKWVAEGNSPAPATNLESTGPDYQAFLDQIIASALYQKILTQSATSPIVNTAFTASMGALILAATGRPNVEALQAGVTSLLSSMTITQGDISSLRAMLTYARLDNIISLGH
jgi:hypothetical protein